MIHAIIFIINSHNSRKFRLLGRISEFAKNCLTNISTFEQKFCFFTRIYMFDQIYIFDIPVNFLFKLIFNTFWVKYIGLTRSDPKTANRFLGDNTGNENVK